MGIELNSFRALLHVTVPESLSSILDSPVIIDLSYTIWYHLLFLSRKHEISLVITHNYAIATTAES